jgi:hypothetical protein
MQRTDKGTQNYAISARRWYPYIESVFPPSPGGWEGRYNIFDMTGRASSIPTAVTDTPPALCTPVNPLRGETTFLSSRKHKSAVDS